MVELGNKTNTLLAYQTEGVDLIKESMRKHKIAILAHKPGLGKTRQALEYANNPEDGKNFSRVLIIATKSTLHFWREEATLVGIEKDDIHLVLTGASFNVKDRRFIILSHDMAIRVIKKLCIWSPQFIVVDEAHLLKNPKTKRSKAMKMLSALADNRLALTGMPITNSALDIYGLLYSIKGLHCIEPYSNYMKFGYTFCKCFNNGLGMIFSGQEW